MATLRLGKNLVIYSLQEAKEVIARYSFGVVDATWARDVTDPPDIRLGTRPAYSYRAYDCVPASPGGLSYADVLLTAGIESQVNSFGATQAMAVASDIDQLLVGLSDDQPFWDMDRDRLEVKPKPVGAENVIRARRPGLSSAFFNCLFSLVVSCGIRKLESVRDR